MYDNNIHVITIIGHVSSRHQHNVLPCLLLNALHTHTFTHDHTFDIECTNFIWPNYTTLPKWSGE